MARAWATTFDEQARHSQAGHFAHRALLSYAWAVAPSLVTRNPRSRALDNAAIALADEMAIAATLLPIAEALHQLTSLYTVLLPQGSRGKLGAFYTPPALARRLIQMATEAGANWATARVLDPAAGGGIFLVEAALRMMDASPDCEPAFLLAQIENRLVGFELDHTAAGLAQLALEIALADLIDASGRSMNNVVRVCDTLEREPEPLFDLVIGNPPYGRVTLTARRRERYARSLYGHANLYGLFTDAALKWTKPEGLIAFLTPAGMLGGQYFSALRGLLGERAPPSAINLVHARRGVFEDALQETLLAVYHKGSVSRPVDVDYLIATSECEASVRRNGSVMLPTQPASPWILPRSPEDARLVARVARMPTRLKDVGYKVSTGPLVWNRFKSQLKAHPSPNSLPIVWAESVTADGHFVLRARKRNHAPFLEPVPGKDDWLVICRPCVLVQRTTAKEQPRRLIAAELTADFLRRGNGVVVENHLNMVLAVGKAAISASVITALLNSRAVDRVFRCISGSVAVSAFELEAVPLPSLSDLREIQMMLSSGASRGKVEERIATFYGIRV